MAALWDRADHYIFALWFLLSFFLLSFFPRLISADADWMSTPYFGTWCGLSANLECRSEKCCTRLAGYCVILSSSYFMALSRPIVYNVLTCLLDLKYSHSLQ